MKKLSIFAITVFSILILAGCIDRPIPQEEPATQEEAAELNIETPVEASPVTEVAEPAIEDVSAVEEVPTAPETPAIEEPLAVENPPVTEFLPATVTDDQPAVSDQPVTEEQIKTFDLTAKQWEFIPSVITVNKGDTVKLNITSIDVTHGFNLADFGVSVTLEPNITVPVEFVADKTGEFTFSCSVFCGEGHGGMTGRLVVQ